jgi:DNA repair protein RAD7
LNPNLGSLRLDFCGHTNNAVIKDWSTGMPFLSRLELLGPFLVHKEVWIDFFAARGKAMPLEGFLITQSPRFDVECVESLVNNHPNLKELRLSDIGKMEDAFLPHIATLVNLASLELSNAPGLSDDAVNKLLSDVGAKLISLDLSGNEALTDLVLSEGIQKHCRLLNNLQLRNLPELTDSGVAALFTSWDNQAIRTINFSRCHELSSTALTALLSHSGKDLIELSLNGWKETSNEALLALGSQAPILEALDIGWCREVDNFVIKQLLEDCQRLRWIKCYGCNRLTESCPRKVRNEANYL